MSGVPRAEQIVAVLLAVAANLDNLNRRNPQLAAKVVKLIAIAPAVQERLLDTYKRTVPGGDFMKASHEVRAGATVALVFAALTELQNEGWTFGDIAALVSMYNEPLIEKLAALSKEQGL